MPVLTQSAGAVGNNILTISLDRFVDIFTKRCIYADSVLENKLDLYDYQNTGPGGTLETIGLKGPKGGVLSSRRGRRFKAKGRFSMDKVKASVMRAEANMVFYTADFAEATNYRYFKNPEDPYRLMAGDFSQEIFERLVDLALIALQGSVHDLAMFGGHPDVPQIAAPTYLDEDERQVNPAVLAAMPERYDNEADWLDDHDEMRTDYDGSFEKLGWLAKLDTIADANAPAWAEDNTYEIPESDLTLNANQELVFQGDIIALFESLLAKASPDVRMLSRRVSNPEVVMKVDSSLFDAYVRYMKDKGTEVEYLRAIIDGEMVNAFDKMVARWNGILVVRSEEFDIFNHRFGVYRARAVLIVRKGIQVLSEVAPLSSTVLRRNGEYSQAPTGLIIYQDPNPVEKFPISFLATPSIGAGLKNYEEYVYLRSVDIAKA